MLDVQPARGRDHDEIQARRCDESGEVRHDPSRRKVRRHLGGSARIAGEDGSHLEPGGARHGHVELRTGHPVTDDADPKHDRQGNRGTGSRGIREERKRRGAATAYRA